RGRCAGRSLPAAGVADQWHHGSSSRDRPPRPRRPLAAHLRLADLGGRRSHGHHRGRRRRHCARHHLRLSRGLGRSGHHANHRRLARPARAHARDLPGGHRRAGHLQHHHHPRHCVVDPLRPRHPWRGALDPRARLRAPGRRGGPLGGGDHAPTHAAQRDPLRDRAGHPAARPGDHRRGRALIPRRRRAAASSGVGIDARGRQEGPDGGLLVADRAAGLVHHADGPVGEPSGRLASREVRPAAPPVVTGPLLDIRRLSTHYVSARGTRVTRAVDDVTLSLDQGQTLGIVGESGSGKTTLALTLLRMLPPAARIVSGEMLFEGADLLKKPENEMRRIRGKRIAMILQDPMMSLNPLFTVGDQVAEPIRVHEGTPRRSAWKKATELLKAVRIAAPENRVREYPHQLSGGMRQRIVGAIAISCEPRILIADEPTTSLDVTIQAQYLNLLRDLQRSHNLALIFITHNLGIVAKMCDQVAVMYAGRLVEAGPVKQIYNAPAHPYTRALLESIPRLGDSRQRLTAIDGQPPVPRAPPPGSAFPPRCPKVMDRCRSEAPPEFRVTDTQTSRCWLSAPVAR